MPCWSTVGEAGVAVRWRREFEHHAVVAGAAVERGAEDVAVTIAGDGPFGGGAVCLDAAEIMQVDGLRVGGDHGGGLDTARASHDVSSKALLWLRRRPSRSADLWVTPS